jgi:xylulokinase
VSGDVYLGVDIGMSSTKSALIDEAGALLAEASVCHGVDGVDGDGVRREHDPISIWWDEFVTVAGRVIPMRGSRRLAGICITGHWPATCLLDDDGKPLGGALLLDDARAQTIYNEIKDELPAPSYGYELVPRLLWLREFDRDKYRNYRVVCSTQNYVVYRLTGEWAMDPLTADSYGCFDVRRGCWDDAMLSKYGLTSQRLPRIAPPLDIAGCTTSSASAVLGLDYQVPVLVGTGDTVASIVGSGAIDPDTFFVCFATFGIAGRLTAPLSVILDGGTTREHLEWLVFSPNLGRHAATAARLVLGRTANSDADYSELESLVAAAGRPADGGVFELTESNGLDSGLLPRASFAGLPVNWSPVGLYHSVMEYFAREIARSASEGGGDTASALHVSGGGAASAVWRQLVADTTARDVVFSPHAKGAGGSALLAAVGLGALNLSSAADAAASAGQIVTKPDHASAGGVAERIRRERHIEKILATTE